MINHRYILKRKIGEGRSKVFCAIDTEFPEKEIAIKFLPQNAIDQERNNFKEEYFSLQRLEHPNIVKSFDLSTVVTKDSEDTEVEVYSDFMTLEYFPSVELLNFKNLKNEITLKEIVKQICSTLFYLHESNYIYYDLKPENILVSDSGSKPQIKLIDLGLAEYRVSEYEHVVKGTAQYIAPELLKKEHHDHTVDFYSLGMILYRIVYDKYPFDATDEIDIYKAHIEKTFVFPRAKFTDEFISVIKKLLEKNPKERFNSALAIINALKIPIDLNITKDFVPAKVFSNRRDSMNILRTYVNDRKSNEVFSIKGFDGAGKTALLSELYSNYLESIYIENRRTKTGIDAVKFIFKKILFRKFLYDTYSEDQIRQLNTLFAPDSGNFIEKLKLFAGEAFKNLKPIVLIDDFNLYDSFTSDILNETIRVMQINHVKIILAESSNSPYTSNNLSNVREIQLTQFTDNQLSELLDLSFSSTFPKRELKKLILLYSDLLPGNIKQFIKDAIILGVIKFSADQINFQTSEELELALQSSHEEIYRLRLSNLTADELKLSQIISAFEIAVEQTVLAGLMNCKAEYLKILLEDIEKKNIIEPIDLSNAPNINSQSFKKYIYSTISNRIKYHVVIANSIRRLFPDFNTTELARQFELGNEHERCAEVLQKELVFADRISNYAYKRSVLEKLLSLNLQTKTIQHFQSELIKTQYKLSDYKTALEFIYKLSFDQLAENEKNEILFIKGSSLIELRKTAEGRNVLNLLLENVGLEFQLKIKVEIAFAEYDLNNYDQAKDLCEELLKDNQLSFEDQGRCYNLMGMIEYYHQSEKDIPLNYFNEALRKYQQAGLPRRIAGMQQNLGIINFELGDIEKSKQHLNDALETNRRIGNIEQQGLIYLNFGVFSIRLFNYEEAIEPLTRARDIFSALGLMNNYGLVLHNLGEVYINICEYQNAYDNITEAVRTFVEINNREEELQTLFLLGKFWYVIGDTEELTKIINQYEYYFYIEDSFNDRYKLKYELLKLMISLVDGKGKLKVEEIFHLIDQCYEFDESNIYPEMLFMVAESFIELELIEAAVTLLKEENLRNISEQNIIFRAEREYLFGKASLKLRFEGMKTPIEYFESAYKLIEDQSITELTWKIVYSISELFWDRGNFHKAKKPRLYAVELITMISDSIRSTKIRSRYLDRPDRRKALEKLRIIGDPARIHEFQKG